MRFETWSTELLVFAKAKMFGVHTDVYEIPLRKLNDGDLKPMRVSRIWRRVAVDEALANDLQIASAGCVLSSPKPGFSSPKPRFRSRSSSR